MSTDLDVFMANVKKAVIDYDNAMIGGGLFTPSELQQVLTEVSELKRRAINAEKEIRALKEINERLQHDSKLMQAALKRYVDEPTAISTMLGIHAAYRHVTGT